MNSVWVPTAGPDHLHSSVLPALLRAGAHAVEVTRCHGEAGYSRQFINRWVSQPELMIVEQDVEIPVTMLMQFDGCKEPWCCAPYAAEALLGCTRFRPQELPRIDVQTLPGTPWWELDMNLYHLLLKAGARPHKHGPPPKHHHGWNLSLL